MPSTIAAKFETRREAEMVVERLVQEFGIERTDIFIEPEGSENSAGDQVAGADAQADSPGTEKRSDAAVGGRIIVSVDVQDDKAAEEVRSAFSEFGGGDAQEI